MNNEQIKRVREALAAAEAKHPFWPTGNISAAALILLEEAGEVAKAVNDYRESGGAIEDVETELYQTAAMCFRMLDNLGSGGRVVEQVNRAEPIIKGAIGDNVVLADGPSEQENDGREADNFFESLPFPPHEFYPKLYLLVKNFVRLTLDLSKIYLNYALRARPYDPETDKVAFLVRLALLHSQELMLCTNDPDRQIEIRGRVEAIESNLKEVAGLESSKHCCDRPWGLIIQKAGAKILGFFEGVKGLIAIKDLLVSRGPNLSATEVFAKVSAEFEKW